MTIAIARPLVLREPLAAPSSRCDRIALIDADGTIVGVNDNWMALAEQTGATLSRVGFGANYLDVCRRAAPSSSNAREALHGIRGVLKGKLKSFVQDYSCDSLSDPNYFRMSVTPICYADARAVITHTDITELWLSKEQSLKNLRQYTRRLINAQEEERERIAREIHDDLGSRIALLSFSVSRLMTQRSRHSVPVVDELKETIDNLTELSEALRNLSHCLHPPLLRHTGICAALKALCEEFSRSHSIEIDAVIPEEVAPFSDEAALCIFRVAQESLHNVAKHAGPTRVTVSLERTLREVRLRVADTGRGFVPSGTTRASGLGLINMKERALCVRGHLEVRSAPGAGTEVRVSIPVSARKSVTV